MNVEINKGDVNINISNESKKPKVLTLINITINQIAKSQRFNTPKKE